MRRSHQALAAALTVVLWWSTPLDAALLFLDRIAIVVEEDMIMASEVESRVRSVTSQFAATPDIRMPTEDAIRDQVVERLIVESLQLQIANRNGIRISDEELNDTLRSIAARNDLSLEEFQVTVTADGMSWSEMREQVRREMAIGRIQQGIMRRRIEITEQEITNFLASELGETITAGEFRLAHMLLALPENATPEEIRATKDRVDALLREIEAGADFQEIAIEHSDGQYAANGGDMGWRKPTRLPSMFTGMVEDMEVGEVRGPVRSGRGFHLVKLLQKRGTRSEAQIAQTNVRHILITPNEIRDEQESEDLVRNLRQEILDGRDFSEVAKLYSDDPGSALSGGDLGWSSAGLFVPEFEAVMQSSEEGVISEVIKTQHGYHLLEVTGRRIEDFSEAFREQQAEGYLRNLKFDEELENWLREIREEAFVEIKI